MNMKPIQATASLVGFALASSLVGCSSDTTSDYAAGGDSGSGNLEAAFSASVVQVIEGNAIVFTDESTGAITEREWDFDGDGSTDSTAKNPTWIPQLDAGAGDTSFTVTLSLNGGAAVETRDDYIEVLALPEASFTIDPDTNPVGPEGVFLITNTSTNADIFEWDLAGGTPGGPWEDASGGTVVFEDGFLIGHKSISLVAKRSIFSSCDDCASTHTEDVTVQPAPDFSGSGGYNNAEGVLQGGAPLLVTFKNESAPLEHPEVRFNWDFEGTNLFTNDGIYGEANSPRSHWYTKEGLYTVRLKAETATLGSPIKTSAGYILVAKNLEDGDFEEQVMAEEPSHPWEPFYQALGGNHLIRPADPALSEYDGPMPSAGDTWLEVSTKSTHDAAPPNPATREGGLKEDPVPTGETDPSSRGAAGVRQEFAYAVDVDGLDIDELSFDAIFVLGDTITGHEDWMAVDVSFKGVTYNLFYRDANSVAEFTEKSDIHLNSGGLPASMTLMKRVSVKLKNLFSNQDIQTGDKVTFWITAGNVGSDLDLGSLSWGYVDNVRLEKEAGTLDVDFNASNIEPGCGQAIQFTDLTFQGGAPPPPGTSWFWNFGDGGTISGDSVDEQNPMYAYATPGTYDVRLTVIHPDASGTKEKVGFIDVSEPVAVGGVYGTGPWGSPTEVTFWNHSSNAQSYLWEFKDNSNGQEAEVATDNKDDVTHTYWEPPGAYPNTKYQVALTAFSGPGLTGCSSTVIIEVDIRQGFRELFFVPGDPFSEPGTPGSPSVGGLKVCTMCHNKSGARNFIGEAPKGDHWLGAENFYTTMVEEYSLLCDELDLSGNPWRLVTSTPYPEHDAYKAPFNSLVYQLVNENEVGGDSNPCDLPDMPKNGPYWEPNSIRYQVLIQWLKGGAQRGQIQLDY